MRTGRGFMSRMVRYIGVRPKRGRRIAATNQADERVVRQHAHRMAAGIALAHMPLDVAEFRRADLAQPKGRQLVEARMRYLQCVHSANSVEPLGGCKDANSQEGLSR